MLRMLRKTGCILMVFVLMALLCPAASASQGTQTSGVHRIAIVLDNSGSMIVEPGSDEYCSRWAEATHALRTFLYMVNKEDKVGLFTVGMSSNSNASVSEHKDAATISEGLTRDNIDQELKKVKISAITATYGLDAAYEWVTKGAAEERWVVILSDGLFYEDGKRSALESVEKRVEKAGGDVHTIFIGLDLDKIDYDGRFGSWLTVYKTSPNGQGIEDTILGISNDIYQMESLSTDVLQTSGEFSYDIQSGTFTWSTQPGLSSYLSHVIIIAQTHDEEEAEQGASMDPQIQMISSDDSFSWCNEEDLGTVLSAYNNDLDPYSGYRIKSKKDFQDKIEKTFLNKRCYIGTYLSSQLGEKIQFQTPPGDYTYRIYYELRDDIVPELVVRQNGAELAADPNKNFFVTEGLTELDYFLKAGETEIPRELVVIEPKLSELHVERMTDRTPAGLYNFSYRDAGENSYPVRMSFQGTERVQTVQVGVDVERYSFCIPEGQELNIDRTEGWLTIETQLPPLWLQDHLKDHLQVDSEKGGLQFDTKGYDLQLGGNWNLIRIPVSFSGPLNLTQEYPIKAVFTTDDAASVDAAQNIKLTQDKPEIVSTLPSRLSWLGIPLRMKIPVAEISAKRGEDTMEGVSIQDATVTGVGKLNGTRLEYDDESQTVYLYAGPVWTWKLLSSGEAQGDVVLGGTVYRNGVIVNSELNCPVTVAWKGSLAWFIAFLIVILVILAAAIVGAVCAGKGLMLLQELAAQPYRPWFYERTYYLSWMNGERYYEVVRNRRMKVSIFKIKLQMPDEEGFFEIIDGVSMVLRGTKTGYRMEERSRVQLKDKAVAVDQLELDEARPISFLCNGMTCRLCNTRRRKPWIDVMIWLAFWSVILIIVIIGLLQLP